MRDVWLHFALAAVSWGTIPQCSPRSASYANKARQSPISTGMRDADSRPVSTQVSTQPPIRDNVQNAGSLPASAKTLQISTQNSFDILAADFSSAAGKVADAVASQLVDVDTEMESQSSDEKHPRDSRYEESQLITPNQPR